MGRSQDRGSGWLIGSTGGVQNQGQNLGSDMWLCRGVELKAGCWQWQEQTRWGAGVLDSTGNLQVEWAIDATESAVSPIHPRIQVALSAVPRRASILISPRAQREKC